MTTKDVIYIWHPTAACESKVDPHRALLLIAAGERVSPNPRRHISSEEYFDGWQQRPNRTATSTGRISGPSTSQINQANQGKTSIQKEKPAGTRTRANAAREKFRARYANQLRQYGDESVAEIATRFAEKHGFD